MFVLLHGRWSTRGEVDCLCVWINGLSLCLREWGCMHSCLAASYVYTPPGGHTCASARWCTQKYFLNHLSDLKADAAVKFWADGYPHPGSFTHRSCKVKRNFHAMPKETRRRSNAIIIMRGQQCKRLEKNKSVVCSISFFSCLSPCVHARVCVCVCSLLTDSWEWKFVFLETEYIFCLLGYTWCVLSFLALDHTDTLRFSLAVSRWWREGCGRAGAHAHTPTQVSLWCLSSCFGICTSPTCMQIMECVHVSARVCVDVHSYISVSVIFGGLLQRRINQWCLG